MAELLDTTSGGAPHPTGLASVVLDSQALAASPAGSLAARLRALLDDGHRTVVVDLSRLSTLSSDVVAALLSARREAGSRGSYIVLRAASGHSMGLLRRSRLTTLFDITTVDGPASTWRHG
jgi:anti-anti-sigma regulatory factor